MGLDDIEKTNTANVIIKKSTFNKLIIGIVTIAIISAFLGGYVLGSETDMSSDILIKDSKNVLNQIPTNQLQSQSDPNQASKKIQGSINFEVPNFVRFIGDEAAPVSIVEFGDYQCPFCKRFFDQTEPEIKKEYIDTGKVKFYFLDFVVNGVDSLTLAEGAWCAEEQGKYYQYHDYVYSNQGKEYSGWGTPENVKIFAKDLGLDVEEFSLCLDSKKYESRVQQLTALATNLGSTGTPTAFIGNLENGYTKITGAQPYDVFKNVIDKYTQ